jgi:hypothetical protein
LPNKAKSAEFTKKLDEIQAAAALGYAQEYGYGPRAPFFQ